MNTSFEDQIRERAYHIWLAGGMADGEAEMHWVSAEQAVTSEIAGSSGEPEVILTKAVRMVAAKPKAAAKPAKAAVKVATKAPRASKARKAELSVSA